MWAVAFAREERCIHLPVHGIVGNAVPTSARGKETLLKWKRTVADAAKQARGGAPLNPAWIYSISAGFSFHMPSHGNRGLDVENFLKPTFDGLAAGLFCESAVDCMQLDRFSYDDSGFKYLFAYRLPDAASAAAEGAGFVISIEDNSP